MLAAATARDKYIPGAAQHVYTHAYTRPDYSRELLARYSRRFRSDRAEYAAIARYTSTGSVTAQTEEWYSRDLMESLNKLDCIKAAGRGCCIHEIAIASDGSL